MQPERSSYKTLSPRTIEGCWVNGKVKKGDNVAYEKEAFDFLMSQMQEGVELKLASERTKNKYKIPIQVELKTPKNQNPHIKYAGKMSVLLVQVG